MAYDFPNSPTDGQLYTSGGSQYVYNSAKGVWQPNTQPATTLRNRFTNPGFVASQENGNTSGNTNGFFIADAYAHVVSTTIAPAVIGGARIAATTPRGGQFRLRNSCSTIKASPIAGDWWGFLVYIEGNRFADAAFGTAAAKPIIIRFGWKSPAGTWHVCVRSASRCYPAPFTITAGQANTDQEITLVIPGDTGGTWALDNTMLAIWWTLVAGSTFNTGTANTWNNTGTPLSSPSQSNGVGTAPVIFELFDVGLYIDTNNTGLAPNEFPINDELRALLEAQRYWCRLVHMVGMASASTVAGRLGVRTHQVMRTTPTYGLVSTPTAFDGTVNNAITGIPNSYGTPYSAELNGTGSGLTTVRSVIAFSNNSTVYISAVAR